MALENGLFIASIYHRRLKPKTNIFRYKLFYLCFALQDLPKIMGKFLSVNKFNIFSFYYKDHGFKKQNSEQWIKDILKDWDIPQANGDVVLLTLPRVFGYAFNPVSFWFCLDIEGKLRAVISEVNNTFGERHCYLSFFEDRSVITKDHWIKSEKIFHVSPFLKVEGHYLFRFYYSNNRIGVWIDYYDSTGKTLITSIIGKRTELNDKNLLKCFVLFPFATLKLIILIHYQAIKLFIKRVSYFVKPKKPEREVSR